MLWEWFFKIFVWGLSSAFVSNENKTFCSSWNPVFWTRIFSFSSIFSFNSYVYYLTRGVIASTRTFNLATRAFNLPTCAFNLSTRAFNLATRAFSLLTRGFELVTRGFEFVTRGLKLVTRGFELVTCLYLTWFFQYFFVRDKICYHKANSGNSYN